MRHKKIDFPNDAPLRCCTLRIKPMTNPKVFLIYS